ncbi:hypothetical protein [Massilia eurypsychrophila]|nr:hypothetical protein [Massilia eurypsychrophila]
MRGTMRRLAMTVLWPSFVAAALAEGCVFSVFDPADLAYLAESGITPTAVYSVGFFALWSLCALSSLLTMYLVVTPADQKAPF